MSGRGRTTLFLVSAIIMAAVLLWGFAGLPPFGTYHGPYGTILDRVAVPERHATDVVSAVTFDYRGFDTIGEEFILFASVVGVTLLSRRQDDEMELSRVSDSAVDRRVESSDAVRLWCLVLAPTLLLFGLYIVTHGHLTPGGGFQGGCVLASALLLLYLGGDYHALRALNPKAHLEMAEALGAGGFVLVGVAGLIAAGSFLKDMLPLGQTGALNSAGTIPLINLAVGLEVGAGFLIAGSEFITQLLHVRKQPGARAQDRSEEGAS
jgi:multicomponent Na+:H+ antiporter subunit B